MVAPCFVAPHLQVPSVEPPWVRHHFIRSAVQCYVDHISDLSFINRMLLTIHVIGLRENLDACEGWCFARDMPHVSMFASPELGDGDHLETTSALQHPLLVRPEARRFHVHGERHVLAPLAGHDAPAPPRQLVTAPHTDHHVDGAVSLPLPGGGLRLLLRRLRPALRARLVPGLGEVAAELRRVLRDIKGVSAGLDSLLTVVSICSCYPRVRQVRINKQCKRGSRTA
mmetsp:Transcript_109583/g.285623  ORF Transcript_109583/g.285623 Transcript_109583/m.285623 type:complete len:227 (-) Transcript_109583:109-789(-)